MVGDFAWRSNCRQIASAAGIKFLTQKNETGRHERPSGGFGNGSRGPGFAGLQCRPGHLTAHASLDGGAGKQQVLKTPAAAVHESERAEGFAGIQTKIKPLAVDHIVSMGILINILGGGAIDGRGVAGSRIVKIPDILIPKQVKCQRTIVAKAKADRSIALVISSFSRPCFAITSPNTTSQVRHFKMSGSRRHSSSSASRIQIETFSTVCSMRSNEKS